MHLSHALELGDLCKDDPDGGLHLLVRVLLDSVAPGLHVADGYSKEQRATTRLLLQRLVRALPKQRKLELAHRAFRTHDILPSNSRLRSSSGIRTTRMLANGSRLFGVSFTPAMRTLWSNCQTASGCCCRRG